MRERLTRLSRAETAQGLRPDVEPHDPRREKLLFSERMQDAGPFDGTVSLILNVHNEGADLAQTVKSFRGRCQCPMEVLIVADRTTDGSLEPFEDDPNVTILRHHGPDPLGCGRAKTWAVNKATGDFILHSDGHNRQTQGSVDAMARLGCYLDAVIQPALGPLHCKPHEQPTEVDPGNCYYGGRLKIEKGLPNIHQSTLRPRRPIKRTECVNNSCFGYPRRLLEAFAGWHEFPGRWGFQEAGFSWRLWFADVPIYCMRDQIVLHRYQNWWDGPDAGEYQGKRKGYPVAGWERRANRRYAVRVLFDDASWEGYWKEVFEKVDVDGDGKARAALDASQVERQRQEFLKVKKRSDIEFWKEIGAMDYDPATAQVKEGVTRGLYTITGGLGNALLCVPAMKALARLSGGPIDVIDVGLHVKGLRTWLSMQPWVNTMLTKDDPMDYRDYRYIIGSYWADPPIVKLDGCTISPAYKQHRTKHEAVSNMEAVQRAGYDGPTPSQDMDLPDRIASGADGGEYVVLCTEAAGRRDDVNKCYPHWEAVCRQLHEAGVRIKFLGNNDAIPRWMDELGENLVGKTEFMDAVRIIAGARLFLGIDNGLAHTASSTRTPQLLVYGTTSPRKNLQLAQALHVISSDFKCAPCFDTPRKNRCANEPKGCMPCMRAIPPEKIARKALFLLEKPYMDAMPSQQVYLSAKQLVQNCHLEMFQTQDEMIQVMDMVRKADPGRILVIGSHHGAWELLISGLCAPGTEFIMVDLRDFEERRVADALLEQQGHKVTFIEGDSTAPETQQKVRNALNGQQVDILFIDGYHLYEYVDADFRGYGYHVAPGGMILFHDISNFVNDDGPGSRKHWDETKNTHRGLRKTEISKGRNSGYGILHLEPADGPTA